MLRERGGLLMKNKQLNILVEGAMMIALATVLSYIKFWKSPYGGSVTLEMLPLVVFALRRGGKWGLIVCITHGILQMFMGFDNVLYCNTLLAQIGCILLDYVAAFGLIGLASVVADRFSTRVKASCAGALYASIIRYVCAVLSGWLLWGSYAWEGWNPFTYSLAYNAVYMIPNTILLVIVIAIMAKGSPKFLEKQY